MSLDGDDLFGERLKVETIGLNCASTIVQTAATQAPLIAIERVAIPTRDARRGAPPFQLRGTLFNGNLNLERLHGVRGDNRQANRSPRSSGGGDYRAARRDQERRDQRGADSRISRCAPNEGAHTFRDLLHRESDAAIAAEHLGIPGQSITGRRFYELLPVAIQNERREHINVAFSEGKTARWEDSWNGRFFVNTAFPVKDGERAVVISKEGTEQLKAEESAQNKRARLKTLIETLPDLIWLKDTAGRYVNCNPKFERFLGADEATLKGKTDGDFLPQAQAEIFCRDADAALKSGRPVTTQQWVSYADDGHQEFVEVIHSPFVDSNGVLKGVMGIARDVTAFKRVEEDLLYTNSLYKTQLDLSLDGILVVDTSGRVMTYNQRFVEIWGIPEAVLRQAADDVFLEAVLDKVDASEEFRRRNGYLYAHPEEKGFDEIRLKNGRRLERYTATIIDDHGAYRGRSWYFRDVTERCMAEERQRKLTEQLFQSQKMDALGQLAGGVAHDLNNALGAILGTADLLLGETSEELRKEYVDVILKASERAGDLTKKLLTFSRKSQKVSSVIDVKKIVDDTASILRHAINKNIRVSVENHAAKTGVVGDDALLQNALLNLGINASHAMPLGGTLVFSLENVELDSDYCEIVPFDIEPGEFVAISVRDTGGGIPPDVLPRIFEPFFTTKEPGQGTGLGLSAVYCTVQKHLGAITVYSETGKGAVFHLYLPVTGRAEVVKADKEVVGATGTVLIVDDEELIRITARSILSGIGYQVLEAANGVEGIKIVKERGKEIDVVQVDMIMPVMGGREAILEIGKLDKSLPIIVSSGFSKDAETAQLISDGATTFLHKPFRPRGPCTSGRECHRKSEGANGLTVHSE